MNSITKTACENGDKVPITFVATNTASDTSHNVVGTITLPASGLRVNVRTVANSQGGVTPVHDVGAFNPVTLKWTIGNLAPGEVQKIEMEFEVTDETKFATTNFIVIFNLSSLESEDLSDNKSWLVIDKVCPAEAVPSDCDEINIILS